jgi:hypothetical protein
VASEVPVQIKFSSVNIVFAAAVALTALGSQQGAAQISRIEMHPLRSMTLSDQEILSGKGQGTPVTLDPSAHSKAQAAVQALLTRVLRLK